MSRPASAASMRTINPTQQTKLNIKLGRTLLDESAGISSIAFNHKPSQTGATRNTSITHTDDSYTLTINDHDDNDTNETHYKGNRWPTSNSYILTLDVDGNSFVLDKVESEYAFNLVSAPWETDANKLATQYKQISTHPENEHEEDKSGDEEGVFAEDDSGPDPDNPFDYRHYLNGLPELPGESKAPSTAATPVFAATKATATPKSALGRKVPDHTRQPQKPRTAPSSRPPPPPQVRLERRASAKRSSPIPSGPDEEDDDGDLVIDMGEGYQPKKKTRTLLTPFGTGRPISLRSAAASASPALSAMHSPAHRDAGSGYEEDDEGEGDEVEEMEVDVEAEVEHESNGDVEELALDSPMPVEDKPAPISRRQSTWDADAEAELQAKLEQALDDEFDDDEEETVAAPVVPVQAQESEEESEEE